MGMHNYLYGGMRKEANWFTNLVSKALNGPGRYFASKVRKPNADTGLLNATKARKQLTADLQKAAERQAELERKFRGKDQIAQKNWLNSPEGAEYRQLKRQNPQKKLDELQREIAENMRAHRSGVWAGRIEKASPYVMGTVYAGGAGGLGYGAYKGVKALGGSGSDSSASNEKPERDILTTYGLPVGAGGITGATLGALIDSDNRLRGGVIGGIGGTLAGLGLAALDDYNSGNIRSASDKAGRYVDDN